MQRTLAWMTFGAVAALAAGFSLDAGCSGSSASTGGSGGKSASTTASSSGAGGAGGGSGLGGGCAVMDGMCHPEQGDTCTSCPACAGTAFCKPGACTNTPDSGICDHVADSCTCANCAEDGYCGDPGLANCTDGGACDPYSEGCHCPNCWGYPACAASTSACNGGKPDGVCDRKTEDCACVDCQGTPLCVPCSNTGECQADDPCSCAACVKNVRCTDPALCVNDGKCAIVEEGCICDDCKDLPECAMWVDGGVDGGSGTGGSTGTGGGHGSGGSSGAGGGGPSDAGTDAGDGG